MQNDANKRAEDVPDDVERGCVSAGVPAAPAFLIGAAAATLRRVRPEALSGLAEPFASASRSLPLRQIQDSKPVLIYPSELSTTAMRLN
jgi:hypothetical protein